MSETNFTFANGRTAKVVRVSPLTWRECERHVERPKPPMQQTELGPEPNFAHPDYVAAMTDYHARLSEARFNALIVLGVEIEVDQDALTRLRARMSRLGATVEEDDEIAYVRHVCISCNEDIEGLQAAVLGVSIPTEEAVSESADGYKSSVEGA